MKTRREFLQSVAKTTGMLVGAGLAGNALIGDAVTCSNVSEPAPVNDVVSPNAVKDKLEFSDLHLLRSTDYPKEVVGIFRIFGRIRSPEWQYERIVSHSHSWLCNLSRISKIGVFLDNYEYTGCKPFGEWMNDSRRMGWEKQNESGQMVPYRINTYDVQNWLYYPIRMANPTHSAYNFIVFGYVAKAALDVRITRCFNRDGGLEASPAAYPLRCNSCDQREYIRPACDDPPLR